jgi:uncharacterized membrane protein YfcA
MSAHPEVLLLLFAVLGLAATVQVLTGFGFGLLALAILGVGMDLRDAMVVIAPAGMILNIVLFVRLRKEFSLEDTVPLLVACLVGVPAGVWLLLNLGPRSLRWLLAIVMIGTVVHRLWMARRKRMHLWHPVKAGIPCGLLSGILGGAFGAGGPPVVTYLVNRPVNRFRHVATVQVAAAIASFMRIGEFARSGLYRQADGTAILAALLAVLAGVIVGERLLNRFSDAGVRRAVLVLLFLGGLYYLHAALRDPHNAGAPADGRTEALHP